MASNTKLHIRILSFSLLAFAFIFLESSNVTEGFQVSLKMYFNTTPVGDHLYFETKQPNFDAYSELLFKVQLICGVGSWYGYYVSDYFDVRYSFGSQNNNETYCKEYNHTAGFYPHEKLGSARFLGGNDPTKNSLSLYGGRDQEASEILVEERVKTGITAFVGSLAITGTSEWKLFEGLYLDGKSFCVPAPSPGSYYSSMPYIPPAWNYTTIGSVFQGCNIMEIEQYKRNHNM